MHEDGRTTEKLQSYLAAILDSSDDAIIGVRLDGIIELWNLGAEKLYGYAAPEVAGRHVALIEPPEQIGEISSILERVAHGEIIRHHRAVRKHKNGGRVLVSVTIAPIRDAGGEVVGASATARDIGERAALESALRTSEERYRSLALASAQIVWTKNAQGEVVDDWPMWRAFTGQSEAEFAGRGYITAVHPEDRERISRVFADALRNGTIYETEYRLRRHDGEYRHMAVRGVPVLEPEGRIREWICSCADITERWRAAEDARQAQQELALKTRFATIFLTLSEREIFAAVLDAVLQHTQSQAGIFGYVDEDGALVFPVWNWEGSEERPASAAPGGNLRFRRAEWTGIWGRALAQQRSLYVNAHEPPGGASVRRALAAPIFFQNERIGVLAIANKATDYGERDREMLERIVRDMAPVFQARLQRDAQERARRRAEEEVRTINAELEKRVRERTAQLEAANDELEAFAYSVSHDLRAPLRAIHGFSRILIEEHAPELAGHARHYLEVVRDNALRMGELIDDLLTFARLGRQPLEKQAIVTADLVAQALRDVEGEIEPRTEIAVRELPPCAGDPALLKQVFINLLANAIKYSGKRPQARIEVGALPRGGGAAVYYVRDNGVGFDMRYAHKLFGVFQRLHHAGEYPGTGIGLATVQRIVHRHGGRVWAEAEPDRGATFYFTTEPEP